MAKEDKKIEEEVKGPEGTTTPEKPVTEETTTTAEAPVAEEAKPPFWREKVQSAYPDRTFESDDEWNGGLEEYLNELTDYQVKGKEANKRLIEILEAEPALAEVIGDVMQGAPLRVALAKHFDPEDFTPQEGDDDMEAWTKESEARKTRVAESKKFDEELAANKIESSKAFDSWSAEKGLDEKGQDEFLDFVEDHIGGILRGRVSPDFLNAMWTAKNHETDVKQAADKAALDEKNKKVEAKKVAKPKGDGLPDLKGTGETKETPKKKPNYFDKMAERYENNKNY